MTTSSEAPTDSLSAPRRVRSSSSHSVPRPARPAPPRQRPRTPTDTSSTQPELRSFLLHLASERGLADNSLHAYRRDLEDVERFLRGIGRNLLTAGADEFRAYLRDQTHERKATKTVSRRLA